MIDEQSYGTPWLMMMMTTTKMQTTRLILTIILTIVADIIGILVHVFDVLFQDLNMPEKDLRD